MSALGIGTQSKIKTIGVIQGDSALELQTCGRGRRRKSDSESHSIVGSVMIYSRVWVKKVMKKHHETETAEDLQHQKSQMFLKAFEIPSASFYSGLTSVLHKIHRIFEDSCRISDLPGSYKNATARHSPNPSGPRQGTFPFFPHVNTRRLPALRCSAAPSHTNLRKLVKSCEFGNLADSVVRDRIVLAIAGSGLQERLLREGNLSLARAAEICRAAELSKKQAQTVQTKSVDALQKKKF
ncbi:hypothetical protein AVEN_143560-1 [Araneus ventricosus]|uniref:Uncharacterized protein n=1 Tax=Araneus ventricosus TaxID=182803 RepID=A0A4Y2AN53_ARAVE|nr:hypothetical protein AVEN_143560-1 [Araneus ventricosus]